MNNTAPTNSCTAVGFIRLIMQKLCWFFFILLRKRQGDHVADPEVGHIKLDIHPLTNSFSGVNVDPRARVAPNAAISGSDAGSRRVAPNAAAVGDETGEQDGAIRGVVCSSSEDTFVDALWDKCCVIFSMESKQVGRPLGEAAFATMYMIVFAVFTKPPAGPIFGVHIRAYYIILGGISIFAVVEAATAAWVFNSHVITPGRLFFARSVLCVGVVLLAFLTPHVLVGSGKL